MISLTRQLIKKAFPYSFTRPAANFFNRRMDEDHIQYSGDIISDYILSSELPKDLAVIEYFKKVNYAPIGDFKGGKCLTPTF